MSSRPCCEVTMASMELNQFDSVLPPAAGPEAEWDRDVLDLVEAAFGWALVRDRVELRDGAGTAWLFVADWGAVAALGSARFGVEALCFLSGSDFEADLCGIFRVRFR